MPDRPVGLIARSHREDDRADLRDALVERRDRRAGAVGSPRRPRTSPATACSVSPAPNSCWMTWSWRSRAMRARSSTSRARWRSSRAFASSIASADARGEVVGDVELGGREVGSPGDRAATSTPHARCDARQRDEHRRPDVAPVRDREGVREVVVTATRARPGLAALEHDARGRAHRGDLGPREVVGTVAAGLGDRHGERFAARAARCRSAPPSCAR